MSVPLPLGQHHAELLIIAAESVLPSKAASLSYVHIALQWRLGFTLPAACRESWALTPPFTLTRLAYAQIGSVTWKYFVSSGVLAVYI